MTDYAKIAGEFLGIAWEERQTGEVTPLWVVFRSDGSGEVILTPYSDAAQKRAVAGLLAAHVASAPSDAVLMVSDAWMRTVDDEGLDDGLAPSEAIDAVECILVALWQRSGPGYSMRRSYRQKDDGALEIISDEAGWETEADRTETSTFAPIVEALRG